MKPSKLEKELEFFYHSEKYIKNKKDAKRWIKKIIEHAEYLQEIRSASPYYRHTHYQRA